MSRTNCAIGKDVVPASFKGVQFYCTDADIEGGRRGAEGEFPFSEVTAYADLGRKIRVYHLTAYFREDNHVGDASALFAACESPQPGLLVHPTRGTAMVACRSVKVTDKLEEAAGETTAEMEFVEANSVGSGLGGILFGLISSPLLTVSQTSFYRDYRPAAMSQPWRTDIIHTAQGLINSVIRLTKQVLPEDAPLSEHRDVFQMEAVATDDGLAAVAANVDASLHNGFTTIASNTVNPNILFNVMRGLANTAFTKINMPNGDGSDSEEAVVVRHRIMAAVGMAEAAMTRKYAYVGEALQTMDIVLAVFEDEAKVAYDNCDNPLFLEIRNYATQFGKMMNDLAYRLPGLVAVDFSGGVHPLVAAYAIYNDATRHRELEARNRVDANGRFNPMVVGVVPT
jgi:prophage DNA circulation protein